MSGEETLSIQGPSDGMKGLVMLVPVVGLPLAFQALGAIVVAGAGFLAISSVLGPFKEKILQATKEMITPSPGEPCAAGKENCDTTPENFIGTEGKADIPAVTI
jgi:hypothetical protein